MSDAWRQVIKVLLQVGVQLLGKLIPFLGTFLGGPLGFIASWLIGLATDALYDWLDRLATFAEIDNDVREKLPIAREARDKLRKIQKDPLATEEDLEKARQDFLNKHRDLGRVRLQQDA